MVGLCSVFVGAVSAAEGILFSASFDRWPVADAAQGGRAPLRQVGSVRLAPGKHGLALALDGRSYLEFPAGANVGERAGTVCLWFRPERWGERTYDSLFGLSDGNVNALHLERAHPSGQLRLVLGGPDTADNAQTRSLFSPGPLADGEWVHIAMTWDAEAGEARLWLDGRAVAELREPGPLPFRPPSILVGCAFARLARAVRGLIDDLVILDHAATSEEVGRLMETPAKVGSERELTTGAVTCLIDQASGALTLGTAPRAGYPVVIGPGTCTVSIGDRVVTFPRFDGEEAAPPIALRLGAARGFVFLARDGATKLGLRYHVQVQEEQPLVLLWAEVANESHETVTVSGISLLRTADTGGVVIPGARRGRIFLDSGGLTGSGSHDLSAPDADHRAAGAMAVTDAQGENACSFSLVSFRTAGVSTRLRADHEGTPCAAEATCSYPGGFRLGPGERLESEVLAFGVYPSGHEALERWADAVMAVNELAPPKHCPSGWNSWYAYRLTITEDLVLENARIIEERFAPLGCTSVQIDHGWQHRDVVGHWVANDRFPHGLNWLHDRLGEMGLSFGLWTAVTQVSEFAPLFTEHPEALLRDAQGQPLVTDPNWYWEPHGRCFTLDATHPLGEELYRKYGEMLRSYGCHYVKNDFQGNLMQTAVAPYDATITRGAPVYRKAMAAFREGMGPEMAYHACNAPLNVAAGLCDVAWVHRDLGNPAGNWEHLRLWANEFASRYHVSGKFYWSDPDYLQVGQGDMNETQVRMAFVALGGGPAFLSDRLPDLPDDRLALIAKCLPSYRRTARPLDLFTSDGYPRVWDLPVETSWGKWHVVGLFNLDEAATRIDLDTSQLALESGHTYVVYDFFQAKLVGEVMAGSDLGLVLRVPVPATSVRLLRVVAKEPRPFVLSTDMHLTQGGVELPRVTWDEERLVLSGVARRAAGMAGHIVVDVPEGFAPETPVTMERNVLSVPVEFRAAEAEWEVRFGRW